jgi:hypothetical protein
MHLKPRFNRLRHKVCPAAEGLEGRQLLTSGAGSNFALVAGQITTPGGSATINFSINPANFQIPKGSFSLGVDVAPLSGSTIQPEVSAVTAPGGKAVSQAFHSVMTGTSSTPTSAEIVPVSLAAGKQPGNYQVTITAQNSTTGAFLVGFYLPGDADGDGTVTKTDLKTIRSEIGVTSSSSKYTFDADVNRDGRINGMDYTLAKHNLGVTTNVSPLVTSTLSAAANTDTISRQTNLPTATFTGTATPGASVTYAETTPKTTVVSTTANASGNYNITVPLGPGANQFLVNVTDSFDQTIAGQISPVTLTTTPVTANAPSSTPTAPGTTTSDPNVALPQTKAQVRAAARAAAIAAHQAKVAAAKASHVHATATKSKKY